FLFFKNKSVFQKFEPISSCPRKNIGCYVVKFINSCKTTINKITQNRKQHYYNRRICSMDYKETLLIPKTEFPMRGNLPNKEPVRRQAWEEEKLYEHVQERTKDRPLFVLHDGPPFANGDLHIGHALNKILKDFIVRYKSMSGYHAPYVPGWNTHGLPIETALIKKMKIKRNEINTAEFRKMCAEYALEQVDNQRKQFKELGVQGDWDNPYITLTNDYEAAQIEVFGEM